MNWVTSLPGSQISWRDELLEIARAPYEKGQRSIETKHSIFDVEKASHQPRNRLTGRGPCWRLVGWLTIKGAEQPRAA